MTLRAVTMLACGLASAATLAQEVPAIRFDSVPEPLKLPKDLYLGEVTGVAVFVAGVGNPGRSLTASPGTRCPMTSCGCAARTDRSGPCSAPAEPDSGPAPHHHTPLRSEATVGTAAAL